MFLHLDDIQKAVKRHVGEHETRSAIGNTYVLDYINRAWEMVYGTILTYRKDFFSAYYDITLDGSIEYDLPLGVSRIYALEDITSGSTNAVDTQPMAYENRFIGLYDIGTKLKYYIRSGTLGIPSKKAGGTLRVWYPSRPRELFTAKPATVTNTTCTFSATPEMGTVVPEDDYYNGMFLVTPNGQVREITGCVGSTSVFTVDSAWATNPTAATTSVSLTAPIGHYQGLISLRAGILWRADLDMPIYDLETQYTRMENPLLKLLETQQTHRSQQVTKIPR